MSAAGSLQADRNVNSNHSGVNMDFEVEGSVAPVTSWESTQGYNCPGTHFLASLLQVGPLLGSAKVWGYEHCSKTILDRFGRYCFTIWPSLQT